MSVRRVFGIACLAAAIACGERSTLGISGPPPGSSGGPFARDAMLVGSWWRIVLFTDDNGASHASETTWRFTGEGSATRTVVATNLTFGFFDTVVAHASWHTEGGTVVITYKSPDSGTVRFAYHVGDDTLLLDTRAFVRIP
ncbi:MAG TPA: hypothetical protein VMM77_12695 [Gemmatimonadaceae bacterium]|nr:hypothetical protein [Gemmatimonadaceae bacterium]